MPESYMRGGGWQQLYLSPKEEEVVASGLVVWPYLSFAETRGWGDGPSPNACEVS